MTDANDLLCRLLRTSTGKICPICAVLLDLTLTRIRGAVAGELDLPYESEAACASHGRLFTDEIRRHRRVLRPLVEHPSVTRRFDDRSRDHWRWWRRRGSYEGACRVCAFVSRTEGKVLNRFALALEDIRFLRAVRNGPLICRVHHARLRITQTDTATAFFDIEHAKLVALQNELLRSELLTHDDQDRVDAALGFLFSVEGATVPTAVRPREARAVAADNEPPEQPESSEVIILRWQVKTLTQKLGEVEIRAAAQHYRLAAVTDERDRLERGYNAMSAEVRALRGEPLLPNRRET